MTRHGDKTFSELWNTLPWKKFRREVFRLQTRLYKAVQAGNLRKVNRLQRLILRSRSARFLAIRQVTQLNQGKKTAGVDGKKSLNFKQRFDLEVTLSKYAHSWKHQGLRSIPIPKKDGTTRMLKVPTIQDRAWQKLIHYALDAAHEVTFAAHSYGFRPGRSAHDAQTAIFHQLNSNSKGYDKLILEMDIAKCFDRIDHKKLMEALMLPRAYKQGVFGCLKAGQDVRFGEPEQGMGTPQGGIISPTLANIALNDLDHSKMLEKWEVKLIRYADDMIAIIKPEYQWMQNSIKAHIEKELAKWGLELKSAKTRFSKPTDGFDFLGWRFYVQSNNGKFRTVPSKDNYRKVRRKIKDIVNCSNKSTAQKANELSRVVRGWRNYHRYCNMENHSLWFLSHATWKRFRKDKNATTESVNALIKKTFPSVSYSENGFAKVTGTRSPYDGDFVYWSKRNSKLYSGKTVQLLKKQDFRCSHCGCKLTGEERVHLHHIDGNHNNWKDKNLTVIHETCHDYIHMTYGKIAR